MRRRRREADLRRRVALRPRRVRVEPRPDRAVRHDRRRRRPRPRGDRRPRPPRLDVDPAAGAVAARRCSTEGVDGLRVGVIRELDGEGIDADVAATRAARRPTRSTAAGAKVDEASVPAAVYGLSAYYLIAPAEASSNLARYDGIRYGLRVDAPTTGDMYDRTRTAGLRRRGEAADHARHLRAVGRLLRRLLRQGPAGAHADPARLRRRLRAVRPPARVRRRRARRSGSATRPPTRSRCTSTTSARSRRT